MSGDWVELAATASDDELREKILTGFKDGKPFTPYVPSAPWWFEEVVSRTTALSWAALLTSTTGPEGDRQELRARV